MKPRAVVILALTFGLLAAPLAAGAQQTGKVHRIGYLAQGWGSGAAHLRPLDAFRQGLRELGWIEGQNIVIESAGQSLGLQLQLLQARGPAEFEGAFAAMVRERAAALLVTGDSMFFFHRVRLADLALKSRLPSTSTPEQWAEAGAFMAYGPSLPDLYRRAATYVDKILKGAKPADLPVEQPTKFELVINLKTANALGLTIPPSLLLRADEVIE